MIPKGFLQIGVRQTQEAMRRIAGDLWLLFDNSQLNRRTRKAWRGGRAARATFLLLNHQRRRLTRRREIRRLVEG